nr:E3 ubiquitin-protein ligase MIB2-like [Aedes albopictus]
MLAPGIRVVRGPNWIWQNQDDGEGHVGTLCEIGRSGSTHSPEKTVVVNWDSGHRTNYRVGYQKQYDLIVVDNAQIGVKHPNIICDGCNKPGIAGIRFRCVGLFQLRPMCHMLRKRRTRFGALVYPVPDGEFSWVSETCFIFNYYLPLTGNLFISLSLH